MFSPSITILSWKYYLKKKIDTWNILLHNLNNNTNNKTHTLYKCVLYTNKICTNVLYV